MKMVDLLSEGEEKLLPESARLIASLVGLPRALKLVDTWGGTTFPISKNKTRDGQIRFEVLTETVGIEAAQILTRHFGGEVLAIPRCAAAMRELRYRDIRRAFDTLSRDYPASHAVNQLARQHEMTERWVWYILKRTDHHDNGETRQDDLF